MIGPNFRTHSGNSNQVLKKKEQITILSIDHLRVASLTQNSITTQ